MTEREEITAHMDALVDTYHGGTHTVDQLLILRRDLAVNLYRLSAFIRQVYGEAMLGYVRRKYTIACEMVAAQNADAKMPQSKIEPKTEALNSTFKARTDEAWAEAEKEALRAKIDFAKQVLASMQQEIAYEASEKKTAHFQNQGR